MKGVIENSFYPLLAKNRENAESLLQEINQLLKQDGYKLIDSNTGLKAVSLDEALQLYNNDGKRVFKEGTFGLFISHRDNFKRYANDIKKSLVVYGISSFVAHEDIEPTTEWIKEIEKALFEMDALIALLSKGFSESVWTNQEIGYASGREKLILSAKFEEDPQGFISRFQALPVKKNDIDGFCLSIVENLIKNPITKERMITSYFSSIQNSGSFDESKKWATLLPYINNVNENQINHLIDAYNNNTQAYNCFLLNGQKGDIDIASRINSWLKEKKYKIENTKIVKL